MCHLPVARQQLHHWTEQQLAQNYVKLHLKSHNPSIKSCPWTI